MPAVEPVTTHTLSSRPRSIALATLARRDDASSSHDTARPTGTAKAAGRATPTGRSTTSAARRRASSPRALAGRAIDAVYSSDLRPRARDSADRRRRSSACRSQSTPGLREVDVGDWSGRLPHRDRAPRPGGLSRAGGTGGRAGTAARATRRWARAWSRRSCGSPRAHPGQTLLIVTHGGSIRACRAHARRASTTPPRGSHRRSAASANCEVAELHVADGRLAEAAG